MTTATLAPASAPTGVDAFLNSTLTSITTKETTSPAPAKTETTTPATPAAPAEKAEATAPPPSDPSTETKTDGTLPDIAAIQKQLGEQTRANKKLGKSNIDLLKKNQEMARELQELRTKFDPSYTPPAGPSPEQERAVVEFQTRETVSRKFAEDKYGLETVQAKIYAEDSPYRQLISEHPWVHQRVLGAESPVMEIFQVLDEFEVLNTYGRTTGAVLENVQGAIKDKLWKEWTAQAKAIPAEHAGKPVATMGQVRGDAGPTQDRSTPKFELHGFNRHIP